MNRIRRVWNSVWFRSVSTVWHRQATAILAAVTLIIILTINVLFWPIPYLGFQVDFLTGTIISIEPGSSAADVGLQIGDRILRLYNQPWDVVLSHPNLLSLIGPREQPVAISVERMGVVHTFALVQGMPDTATQIGKVTNLALAMLCWLTGYILGVVRRHETSGSPLVAWFWLGMGGVLGSYAFARSVSYPLMLVLQWLLFAVLLPTAVYIHIWFPVRPVPPQHARIARSALVGSWILLNCCLLIAVLLWQPSTIRLVIGLSTILPVGFFVGFVGSGMILRRAYGHIGVAHVRRQIRLIMVACFFVAFTWLLLLVLPTLFYGTPLIADNWIDLIAGAVPLAYLIGGVVPDLYRLDRLALRLILHIGTTTILSAIFATITVVFALNGMLAALWTASCFVLLYRPVQQIGIRLLPAHMHVARTYHALHTAITNLTTTLEAPRLIDIFCTGVRTTFGRPALAFYLGAIDRSNTLTLAIQEHMPGLPLTIAPGLLTHHLGQLPQITESRDLYDVLMQTSITQTDEQALRQPSVVLWCPIRHTEGHLLGVLLLGMRGDLDPYRAEDMREMQSLLDGAALAFANSAEYTQRREAEATIRQLYEQLQQAQLATAAAIARELHDEILNVSLRLNVEALQRLLSQVQEPHLRAELELILEGEQTMGQTIRLICEDLNPTGMDDPLGLPSLLRQLIAQIQGSWPGQVNLVMTGAPCPIAALKQREALGIAREALTNAVKHAGATEITVTLRYPNNADIPIQLVISDNGQSGQIITVKPGHWGVRSMYERARSIDGTLQFHQEANSGTTATLFFSSGLSEAPTESHAAYLAHEGSYATMQTV